MKKKFPRLPMTSFTKFNSASDEPSRSKFGKNIGRYVENTNKKLVFFMTNMSSQPLWLIDFIEILLVIEFQITRIYCWLVFL